MRVEITEPGIFMNGEPVAVGEKFTIKGNVPPAWQDKYKVISDDPKPDAVMVTGDAPRRGRPPKDAE